MRHFAPLVLVALIACGDSSEGPRADANTTVDAAASTDASAPDGAPPDANLANTECLPTDDLFCDTATEVCVVSGPVGPTDRSECSPVPNGCENDRTCDCLAKSLCPQNTVQCTEPAPNRIYCDNGSQ